MLKHTLGSIFVHAGEHIGTALGVVIARKIDPTYGVDTVEELDDEPATDYQDKT